MGTKFILLTSSLVLITAFVIGLYVVSKEKQANYDLLLDHGRSLALMIARNSERAISTEDSDSLRQIMDIISTDPAIAYIFILNADERVLIYETDEDFPIHIPPMRRPVYFRDNDPILHKSFYNKEDEKHYINIVAPVFQKEPPQAVHPGALRNSTSEPIGYIHLGISQESIKKRTKQYVSSILLFTTLIIIPGITVTIFVVRRIIAPINDLNQATREIAEGKLDRQISIQTNDEVSDLARAFNHMLVQLQLSQKKVARHTADLTIALDRMKQEAAERERTEQAMKESEKKYRAIFEESKDVIFIASPDGLFLDINRAGAELFGYPTADSLRRLDPARDLYDEPHAYGILRRILEQQGFVKDYEARMKRSDGEKLTVLVTASTVRDEEAAVWTYRGVFHDVTEKRRLEQQLVQSQKMEAIGQLAGGIAHDFNNILTAIMGYGNLLLMDMPGDSPLRDHAEHILSSSERAANLTRSLLAFSRKQVISPRPVNLNHIVTALEKMLIRLIGEDIELRTRYDAQDVMILADSGQIEQVLINLCTNARDAMPEGGLLTITIATVIVNAWSSRSLGVKPGPYALITVSDTGTGIDEKIREKIFDPFFTTKATGKGTGLGLSIAYGIVKQHNGFIVPVSDIGKGTLFKLYFPLIGTDSGETAQQSLLQPKGGTETILLAEDDPEVRKLIRLVLTENGYRVMEAEDGQDALAVLSRSAVNIHLLLLDVIMPRKNGKEVYDIVRRTQPDVKAIFMSGYTADIIDRKGIDAENLNFISKPIMPHELLRLIRAVLDCLPYPRPPGG